MNKNNIKKISLALLMSTAVMSCSKNALDKINEDKNHPVAVPSNLTITDVITSSAFSVTGGDYAFYSSVYIEHNVGIASQMYNAEVRSGEPFSSATYNNAWIALYGNIYNLKKIIAQCSPGGSESNNPNNLGIAQVLMAYNLAIQTDVMGDIPWTEAGQPGVIFQPKLDKQQAIYADIMGLLNSAIANLATQSSFTPTISTQDLLFGGNLANWTKMAYGLRARYKMRLSFREAKYQEVIDDANKSFDGSTDKGVLVEGIFNKFDGTNASNPFYRFFKDRDYYGASQSLHDKLVTRNDPRDANFFKAYPGAASLVFAPNGSPDQIQRKYGVSALTDAKAPIRLLSYHELQFLKAEAYARLGNIPSAQLALKAGIEAAFVKVGLTAAAGDTYYASILPLVTANPLKEIMVQKYLAFYQDEAIETYNDIRRLKAMGNDFITLSNALPMPLRFTYGSSDVTTNNNIKSAYGDGQYVKTENVWWAGGTR